MTHTELLSRALKFDGGPLVHVNGVILPDDYDSRSERYTIEARFGRKNELKWAICRQPSCLSKSQRQFIYESMPSSRTEDFIEDTRFDSAESAFEFLSTWRVDELSRVEKLGYLRMGDAALMQANRQMA